MFSCVNSGVVIDRSPKVPTGVRLYKGVWLPEVEVNKVYNKVTQGRTGPETTIGSSQVTLTYTVTNLPDAVDRKKADLQKKVNAKYSEMSALVSGTYTDDEVKTWDQQKAEGVAFTADPASATPLVDSMALARGIDKLELVTRINANADLYANAIGTALGRKQGIEDLIYAAVDLPELDLIERDELGTGWG